MSIKSKIAGVAGLAVVLATLAIGTGASAYSEGHDTRVRFVNNTNHTLTNILASRIGDRSFHGDWLGRNEVAPGQAITVDFDDGAGSCLMDVRAVFSDRTYIQHRVNVCTQVNIVLNGN